jgi:diaminohydroxyphosphoribosylaminopyrimidine deaminase/5-amino-6-(5-phosphoribosylamino)uracil reductase
VTVTSAELAAMRRAIVLSAFGLGITSPNPPVGCVVLDRDGRAVGEGYHVRKGEPHAEVHALRAAGHRATGGTAVVTLEPCNHHGRTPPCHQALIDAGISRVLVAVIDPTSRGEGGVARLREAGLSVAVDVLPEEARLVLGSWLATFDTRRPTVTWCYSWVDGEISSGLVTAPGVGALRCGVDLVLDSGGHAAAYQEAVGPSQVVDAAPRDPMLEAFMLYERNGVRHLLIDDVVSGQSYCDAGLVDRVVVDVRAVDASRARGSGEAEPLPVGYRIVSVRREADWVRLEGARSRVPTSDGAAST